MRPRTTLVVALSGLSLVASGACASARPGHERRAQPPAPAAATPAPAPAPAYTLPLAQRWMASLQDTTLARTAGYYLARRRIAAKMIEVAPDLTDRLRAADLKMNAAFDPAYHAILAELTRRDPSVPAEWKKAEAAVQKTVDGQTYTKADVEAALSGATFDPKQQRLEERALLCAMHPAYRDNPVHEFNEGFTVRSAVPIQGDPSHQFVITHPVSWAKVGSDPNSLFLGGGLGAGPLIFRVQFVRAADTGESSPEALKALLTKYGPQGEAGSTLGDGTLSSDGRTAMREIRGTRQAQGQTVRTFGRWMASNKGDALGLCFVGCLAPVDPAKPEADDAALEALCLKYLPTVGKVMDSMVRQDVVKEPAKPAEGGK